MEKQENKTVIHTKLETNLIAAIEYVLALRKNNGVKANLLTLAKELGITSIDYAQIRAKKRGFPKAKIASIVGILEKNYKVRKDFLYDGVKPIVESSGLEVYTLKDDGNATYSPLQKRLIELERENAQLLAKLADKEAIIEAQALAIKNFKALYEGIH